MLVNGIVGDDTVEQYLALFEGLPVDVEGLIVSQTATFTWHATHDFERWVTSHESADVGCDLEWVPDLPEPSRLAPALFLGSMNPGLQRRVLEQSAAEFAGADSMAVFLEQEREAVMEVTDYADILFLNRHELALLSGSSEWIDAARQLIVDDGPRCVVVKLGPEGAALVTCDQVVIRPAAPVATVVDPTGAGDALAGGFLGHCAACESHDERVFADALDAGLRCAAAAISSFGPAALRAFAGGAPSADV